MIDVSKYEKIGEYRDEEMIWVSPKYENIVYIVMFGVESYIGSSINIRNRFQAFVSHLKRGNLESKKVQNAFDRNSVFDLYAIEFTDKENLRKREEFYINTMHPSLNVRMRADYLYRDSRPPSAFKQKNVIKDYRPPSVPKQKNNVKRIRPKKDRTGMKGVVAKIPMSMYCRMSRLKYVKGKTIEDMFAQAIAEWLDIQDSSNNTYSGNYNYINKQKRIAPSSARIG